MKICAKTIVIAPSGRFRPSPWRSGSRCGKQTARLVLTLVAPSCPGGFPAGMVYRVLCSLGESARSPSAFPRPAASEKSLPWIQNNPVENPAGPLGASAGWPAKYFCFVRSS